MLQKYFLLLKEQYNALDDDFMLHNAVADQVGGAQMNPVNFWIFFFFFSEGGGSNISVSEMIISSKQAGPIGHCFGDFDWSKGQFCCIQQLLTHSHTVTPFDAPGKQAF